MKTIIMTLLITLSLSSCGFPEINPQERCVVSFTFDKCRCHLYDLMTQSRISDAYDKEVVYCDDIIGFHAESWLKDITPWAKEVRRYIEHHKKLRKVMKDER